MTVSAIQRVQQPDSMRSRVARALSAAIISGELAPGTLVSVPTLATRFAVSATPVREAMLDLEKRGFVEPVRNKGFRVTEVRASDLDEIVQVRQLIEAPIMHKIAEVFPGDRADEFRDLAKAIVRAAESGDLAAYLSADRAFHLELIALVDNRRLTELVAEMRSQTRMTGLADLVETRELAESAAEHLLLIDFLVDGRGVDAEALMLRHIGHVAGWWAGRSESPERTGQRTALLDGAPSTTA